MRKRPANLYYRAAGRFRHRPWHDGLPARAVNLCDRLGLCSAKQLRGAVQRGVVVPGKHSNYSAATHTKVLRWLANRRDKRTL